MSTYVTADIHGHFDELMRLLEIIDFSDEDELIIAGDYIDRGTQSLEMLLWIEKQPANITFLKGNHDYEFTNYVCLMDKYRARLGLKEGLKETIELYHKMSNDPEIVKKTFDKYETIKRLVMGCAVSLHDLKRWEAIISRMPLFYELNMYGRDYVIVHAGFYEDKSLSEKELEPFYLYSRGKSITWAKPDTTVIAGHTPTFVKGMPMYADGKVFCYKDLDHNFVFYDIDCGCGYIEDSRYPTANLACIRLEDEAIFYVNETSDNRDKVVVTRKTV